MNSLKYQTLFPPWLAIASLTACGGDVTSGTPPSSSAPAVAASAALAPGTFYTLSNRNSGKCIDEANWSTANGTALQQYRCGSNQANQQWQLRPAGDGYYTISPRHAPWLGWDVTGGPAATERGAKVQLWGIGGSGGANQQWKPVPLGDGAYKFIARHSGKCLDVPAASKDDGVQLQQWDCNDTAAQAFVVPQDPDPPPDVPRDDPNKIEVGVKNGCGFPIWINAEAQQGRLEPDRAELRPGQSRWYYAPKVWTSGRVNALIGGPNGPVLEKAELTLEEKPGGPVLNYNVTYVDWLGLPLRVEGIGGGAGCRPASCDVPLQQVHSGCPDGLFDGSKCVSLRSYCLDPGNQGKEVCSRLNGQIAACASSKPGCQGARGATTAQVYACSGPFFSQSPRWCAALNRNMLDAPDSADNSQYYQRWPYNTYAKWVHQVCPGLYAFSFDDFPGAAGASGFRQCTQGQRLQITFCPKG